MDTKGVATPEFTPRQLDWLERQFPEVIGQPSTTPAEFYHRAGQRSVIAAIRQRIQKQ